MSRDQSLAIEFVDELYEVEEDEEFTFGRAAMLVIDEDNSFLSRVVGDFVQESGLWWLANRSSSSPLSVVCDNGVTSTLAPGASVAISCASGAVRFRAGRSNYEFLFRLASPPSTPGSSGSGTDEGDVFDAPDTQQFGVITLNSEQRAMLAMFARDWLIESGGSHRGLPQNQVVATKLGWSLKKLDRKLDYLCARLSDAGVSGLRGERGSEASDRRRRLVDHVLEMGMIDANDLPE